VQIEEEQSIDGTQRLLPTPLRMRELPRMLLGTRDTLQATDRTSGITVRRDFGMLIAIQVNIERSQL
jgi:hypothetical protein